MIGAERLFQDIKSLLGECLDLRVPALHSYS